MFSISKLNKNFYHSREYLVSLQICSHKTTFWFTWLNLLALFLTLDLVTVCSLKSIFLLPLSLPFTGPSKLKQLSFISNFCFCTQLFIESRSVSSLFEEWNDDMNDSIDWRRQNDCENTCDMLFIFFWISHPSKGISSSSSIYYIK